MAAIKLQISIKTKLMLKNMNTYIKFEPNREGNDVIKAKAKNKNTFIKVTNVNGNISFS